MTTVTNGYGRSIDFDAAVALMDDDLRETLAAAEHASEQAFFDAYSKAHAAKFDEEFEPAKPNPVW